MDCASSLITIKAADTENYRCPDCPGTSTHVLPEFACFVCEPCSLIHRDLGHRVRRQTEQVTQEEAALMAAGGNKAIKEFFKYYCLEQATVSDKYRTRAACFYRDMISKVALDLKVDDFPDLHEGSALVQNARVEKRNEEAKKYHQTVFQVLDRGANDVELQDLTKEGILIKICRCFLKSGRKVARKVGWKVNDFKEIKEGPSKTSKNYQTDVLGTQLGQDRGKTSSKSTSSTVN